MRINALPIKSKTSSRRPKDRLCRAGCNKPETLNHVLQQCHRTHGPRINRHDTVVSVIARALETTGYEVHVEPKIQTDIGMRKPDIVAKLEVTALIIDAQVVNDQISLDGAHARKIDYYNNINLVKEKYKVQNATLTSATLS
ncbi:reverse transcriptase [Lasius niger]|uniref:Reverse transcriptase n=1 Tax=Lasius niger TaxID=67767 RepID=A0A0J7K3Y2_LASNI|nr:reverse transcriptase [Lasius niger]